MAPIAVHDRAPWCEQTQPPGGDSRRFAFDFPVLDASDIHVAVDGVSVPRHDYTLDGLGAEDGGSVTLKTAPVPGSRISIWRQTTLRRVTDFTPGADLRATVLNEDLTRAVLLLQECRARALAALRRRPLDAELPLTLPETAARAGRRLGFDAGGRPDVDSHAGTVTLFHLEAVFAGFLVGSQPPHPTRPDGTALRAGDLCFDDTIGELSVYDGALWRQAWPGLHRYLLARGTGRMLGDLDLSGNGMNALHHLNGRDRASDVATLDHLHTHGDVPARDFIFHNAWELARIDGLSNRGMANTYLDIFTDETGLASTTGAQYDPANAVYDNDDGVAIQDMTLLSRGIGIAGSPNRLRVLIGARITPISALNDDVAVSLSRDGGATWTLAPVSSLGTGGDDRTVFGGTADLSAQPTGTDVRWRLRTLNGAAVRLHRIGLQADLPFTP